MRDGEQPLEDGQYPVELLDVGIGEIQMDGLLLVGRRVLVAQKQRVRPDTGEEAGEAQVPVEPLARVLLTDDDEQDRQNSTPPTAHDQE
mgnify:CR=1 FL=1